MFSSKEHDLLPVAESLGSNEKIKDYLGDTEKKFVIPASLALLVAGFVIFSSGICGG